MDISPEFDEGTRGSAKMSEMEMERLVTDLAEMGREGLIECLRGLDCGFHMDFTDEFLISMSLNGLRHMVLAACLQEQKASVQAH
jgi:hypothetical protein